MIYIQSNARQAADNFALEYWLTKKGFDDLTFTLDDDTHDYAWQVSGCVGRSQFSLCRSA